MFGNQSALRCVLRNRNQWRIACACGSSPLYALALNRVPCQFPPESAFPFGGRSVTYRNVRGPTMARRHDKITHVRKGASVLPGGLLGNTSAVSSSAQPRQSVWDENGKYMRLPQGSGRFWSAMQHPECGCVPCPDCAWHPFFANNRHGMLCRRYRRGRPCAAKCAMSAADRRQTPLRAACPFLRCATKFEFEVG